MNKYIDAEKLKYEIEIRNLSNYHTTTEGYEEELYEIIDSLQQEQPQVADASKMEPEVDLEEEILNQWEDYPHDKWPKCPYHDFTNIARHFYELGKNSK